MVIIQKNNIFTKKKEKPKKRKKKVLIPAGVEWCQGFCDIFLYLLK